MTRTQKAHQDELNRILNNRSWLSLAITKGKLVTVRGMGEVILDISALAQYSGQGKCRRVRYWCDTADKYREAMKSWARRINWRVAGDYQDSFQIERK